MRTLIRILCLLPLLATASRGHAEATPMAPGVLLDAAAGRAIVADRAGYARAISLADGGTLWSSGEIAYPVLETGGRVLALGRLDVRGIGLLLVLDAASGAVIDRVAFDVPEHVAATVMPRPKSTFSVVAEPTAEGARVHWREASRPLRGAYLGDGSDDERITEGAFDLVFDGPRHLAVARRGTTPAPLSPPPDLAPAERLPGLGERQFRAHDDRAAMSSTVAADERFGARWQWTLRERGAGRSLAGPALPYAYLPFAIAGDVLVYRTEPVAWLVTDERVEQHGARLVAWDFGAGAERWFLDVFDPVYRGPMPP